MNVFRREKVTEEKVGVNEGFYTFHQRSAQKVLKDLHR
jgi:hypothetical protein